MGRVTLWEVLEIYDSTSQSDHGGLGTVFGAQFGKNISHLTFHRVFANGELSCNLLIGISIGNRPQHASFSRCEGILAGVFSKLVGGLGRNILFPSVDGTDRVQ
jgi:hypothetical protein